MELCEDLEAKLLESMNKEEELLQQVKNYEKEVATLQQKLQKLEEELQKEPEEKKIETEKKPPRFTNIEEDRSISAIIVKPDEVNKYQLCLKD